MGADGENPRKLLQAAPGDRFLQVQWSPAGNRIAYIKLHNDDAKSQTAIETVPVSGGVSATMLAGQDRTEGECTETDHNLGWRVPARSKRQRRW